MTQTNNDYNILAKEIIVAVGGSDNIERVIHCVTRLLFYLKDSTIPNNDEIESIDGVLGVIESTGQYQVVVGAAVEDIYKSVMNQLFSSDPLTSVDNEEVSLTESLSGRSKMKYWFNQLIGIITGAVAPVISILAASNRAVVENVAPEIASTSNDCF